MPEPDPDDREDTELRRRWQSDTLLDLAATGLRMARTLERQVAAAQRIGPETALSFVAISRAVRQSILLGAALHAEAPRKPPPLVAPFIPPAQRAVLQKTRVRFLVDMAIKSVGDRRRIEQLQLELDERMDDPDFDAGLGQQQVGVAVAGLCRQLGIAIDLSGFTAEELGMEQPPRQITARGHRE